MKSVFVPKMSLVKKSFLFCGLIIINFCSCISKSERIQNQRELNRNKSAMIVYNETEKNLAVQKKAVLSFVASLGKEQKISQLFLVNIEGNEYYYSVEKVGRIASFMKTDSSDILLHKNEPLVPGGCLLFSYNVGDTSNQMRSFTNSIKNYYISHNIVPPYIAIDQEGGDVNRLRHITSALPSEKVVSSSMTPEDAYNLYYSQAKQMKSLGITMNLAPVVEVATESNISFLGSRSFGAIQNVFNYGTAAVNGYENAGVGAVLKHFPGNSDTDPHTGLPEIFVNKEDLQPLLVAPFKRLSHLSPSGIIMSHARVSALDSKTPACLSSEWVSGILRDKIRYSGLIISDDIFMGALNANGFPPEKAAIQAIDAGVDVLMFSEKRFAEVAAVLLDKCSTDIEFSKKIDEAVYRVINFKIKHNIINLNYSKDASGNAVYSVCAPSLDKTGKSQ